MRWFSHLMLLPVIVCLVGQDVWGASLPRSKGGPGCPCNYNNGGTGYRGYPCSGCGSQCPTYNNMGSQGNCGCQQMSTTMEEPVDSLVMMPTVTEPTVTMPSVTVSTDMVTSVTVPTDIVTSQTDVTDMTPATNLDLAMTENMSLDSSLDSFFGPDADLSSLMNLASGK